MNIKHDREAAHDTKHELEFIAGLGTYSIKHKLSRQELIWKYLIAIKKRENWGDINRKEVTKKAYRGYR